MHIWQHVYHTPKGHKHRVSFGLTLSIWDFLFGTSYIEMDERDEKLGSPKMGNCPKDFIQQNAYGLGIHKQRPPTPTNNKFSDE